MELILMETILRLRLELARANRMRNPLVLGDSTICIDDTPPPTKLTTEILTAAIEGFESRKTRIDAKIAGLKARLSGGPAENTATPQLTTPTRKKFSAAARRKMALAQAARWAKIRGESEPSAPAPRRKQQSRSARSAKRRDEENYRGY
jgi:hypothetical protein